MIVELRLPQVSMNMTEATITAWHKEPGERFEEGEPIYAFETEKVEQDVVAPGAGALVEQRMPMGTDVGVDDVICVLDIDD